MTQNSSPERAKLQRSFPKAVLPREQPSVALPSCERNAFAQTSASLTNADDAFLKLLAAVELNRGRSVATICGVRTRYRGVSKSVSAQFRWLAVPPGNTLDELRYAQREVGSESVTKSVSFAGHRIVMNFQGDLKFWA
jgi:hypothetical protein